MKLRLRLALSYLLVILLFLVTLAACWAAFSARPTLEWLDRTLLGWERQLTRTCSRALEQGGWEQVARTGGEVMLPPGSQLVLYPPDGPARVLQGSPLPPEDPAALRAARRGTRVLRPPQLWGPRQVMLWLPLGTGGALSVSLPAALPREIRSEVQRGMALAALAGAGIAFLAGLLLSSRIAGPVKRLARAVERLGEGDLSQRVPESGRDELTELARGFNQMAEKLEWNMSRLQQEKERVERLEANQRQFLADVSHNLRTPLSAALGWTEAMLDGLAVGEEEHHLERIRREVLFVSRTLSRLLDLSRWESQGPLLCEEDFNLRDLVAETADTLAPLAEAGGVSLCLAGDLETPVRGDRQRVRELVQILMENAVQHAGQGARLRVEVRPDRERVEVRVEDDGQGFEPEAKPRKRSRAGLGLAIARRLAAAHGSELQLQSRPGQGTRVSFTLAQAPGSPARPLACARS